MLEPVILPDLFSAISSPVLVAGATPCALPDGPTTDLFGRAVAHASPSAQQAPKKAPLMIDTSGLSGSISSASAALESSLVSKLKQRLTTDGSILFNLIWKVKATPAGRQVYRLRASARRISDKDSGSWVTPRTQDGMRGGSMSEALKWAAKMPRPSGAQRGPQLNEQALLTAPWPSPMALSGGPSKNPNNPRGVNAGNPLETVAHLTSWPTPNTPSGGPNVKSTPTHTGGMDLEGAATLTSWATTTTRDYKDTGNLANSMTRQDGKERNDTIPRQAFGLTAIGSPAATENHGQLNPAHSRWLMGLPPAWDACAPTATPSSRRVPKSS